LKKRRRIALIADELTSTCLQLEEDTKIIQITPLNYRFALRLFRPDFLFVESAWKGYADRWRYKIAAYPDRPERTNEKLRKVVTYAKELGIPTLFWNKEDSVHFERFIDSAKLFDFIFTVDVNAIERYKKVVDVPVRLLMFAVQPRIHSFSGFDFRYQKANFVGSYSRHIHPARRRWQDLFFETLCEAKMDLDAYNRNSDRNPEIYAYPDLPCITEKPKVPYPQTARIYKEYLLSLNVNTVTDSATMFSRRLIEILACGGFCVTNPALSVERLFGEYCYTARSKEELADLVARLKKEGLQKSDYERLRAGAEYVLRHHTWKQRLNDIYETIGV